MCVFNIEVNITSFRNRLSYIQVTLRLGNEFNINEKLVDVHQSFYLLPLPSNIQCSYFQILKISDSNTFPNTFPQPQAREMEAQWS